ncbi:hypothetical protein RM780_03950 [Streptomyces sp. DSM 44917]|uniref:DUF4352 domain-containing protein n=1 Tax=Streptomyces boetiae TaxID=3075541 RepID=A0ABU2L3I4_9ACTN|nr:hypothetical protein [Streptomyces sp. DSM 44917]MDT0306115.1 hypothetical protein [Streptomyces sp. DSM 44917]
MTRTRRAAALALTTTALLAVAACADDDDAPTRANRPAAQQPADGDPEPPAPTIPTDLAIGDTQNWEDGVSATITHVTEIPASEIGQYDYVGEGQTPFIVGMTIVNDSEQPIDLGEFTVSVEGATNGGTAEFVYIESQSEVLEGRLAPGQTREHEDAYSLDVDQYGRDLVIEMLRFYEGMDLDNPTWIGSIGQ